MGRCTRILACLGEHPIDLGRFAQGGEAVDGALVVETPGAPAERLVVPLDNVLERGNRITSSAFVSRPRLDDRLAEQNGRALDELLSDMTLDDFLLALPALRLAHSFFPPKEREIIARLVLMLHGEEPALARSLVQTKDRPDPALVAQGLSLEARVDKLELRYGLAPSKGGNGG